jgi:hypothetical protein
MFGAYLNQRLTAESYRAWLRKTEKRIKDADLPTPEHEVRGVRPDLNQAPGSNGATDPKVEGDEVRSLSGDLVRGMRDPAKGQPVPIPAKRAAHVRMEHKGRSQDTARSEKRSQSTQALLIKMTKGDPLQNRCFIPGCNRNQAKDRDLRKIGKFCPTHAKQIQAEGDFSRQAVFVICDLGQAVDKRQETILQERGRMD